MKKIIKIFLLLLFSEMILGMISSVIYQKTDLHTLSHILNTAMTVVSFPICLINWSYPFYAVGSNSFSIFLIFTNILIQTIFIYFVIKFIKKKA